LSCYLQWFKDNHRYLSAHDGSKDFWIIGGARLILGTLDILDEIWVNRIRGRYDCDTFLPIEEINAAFASTDEIHDGDLSITKFIRR